MGVCMCVCFQMAFPCLHVCTWLMYVYETKKEGDINVCVCGWLQGGPVCRID